jgi:hypothetical protein
LKKLFIIFSFVVLSLSCTTRPCDKIDKNFRPHIVTHHHKSKVYYYYHLTPCSNCISIQHDINGEGYLHYEPADFVTFQDNGEVIYGNKY